MFVFLNHFISHEYREPKTFFYLLFSYCVKKVIQVNPYGKL